MNNDGEVIEMDLRRKLLFGQVAVASFLVLMFAFAAWNTEHRILIEKKTALKKLVDAAYSAVESAAKDGRGKEAAMKAVSALRYGKKGYFWINDLDGVMLMHPVKPSLVGKNLMGLKDPKGVFPFREFVRVARTSGAGFVRYMGPKPGVEGDVPKIAYVRLYRPWGWVIGSGIFLDDVRQQAMHRRIAYSAAAIILTALLLLGGCWIRRSVIDPIEETAAALKVESERLTKSADEIASKGRMLAEGAASQAASLEETSASLEETASLTRQTTENTAQADEIVRSSQKDVEEAERAMTNLNQAIKSISRAGEETRKIVNGINEIAFQTNLLALNAAVEAARAGEAGSGFAVVADEVRSLAMRAAESASLTAKIIDEIVHQVETGSITLDRAMDAFGKVKEGSSKIRDIMAEIAVAAKEQAEGIEQINRAVSELDNVVQQNAAQAEETAAGASDLDDQAKKLKEFVEKLNEILE